MKDWRRECEKLKRERDAALKENDTLICSKCGDMLLTDEQYKEAARIEVGLELNDRLKQVEQERDEYRRVLEKISDNKRAEPNAARLSTLVLLSREDG